MVVRASSTSRGFIYVKRVIGLVFICGAASCVGAGAAPTPAANVHAAAQKSPVAKPSVSSLAEKAAAKSAAKEAARKAAVLLLAPGDEYFGPLKQSIIGIRNTIRDLGLRYDVNHDIAKQTFSSAQLTERSIRDWQRRFPKDDLVPKAVYLLQRLYTKILSQESRDRAHATAMWLLHEFARAPQAKQLQKTLALEHLGPLPTPTPEPEPTYRSIFGRDYPSEFAPPPTPSPEPAASNVRRTALPAIPRGPGASASPKAAPTPSPALTPTPEPTSPALSPATASPGTSTPASSPAPTRTTATPAASPATATPAAPLATTSPGASPAAVSPAPSPAAASPGPSPAAASPPAFPAAASPAASPSSAAPAASPSPARRP